MPRKALKQYSRRREPKTFLCPICRKFKQMRELSLVAIEMSGIFGVAYVCQSCEPKAHILNARPSPRNLYAGLLGVA